jgi:acetoacetyl-CoA synthetase
MSPIDVRSERDEDAVNEPLWSPSPDRVAATAVDRFRRDVHPDAHDVDGLWEWSVSEPESFWGAVWEWCGVVGDRGDRLVEEADDFWKWRFLPDATLNVAENLLADRPGANNEAIIERRENGDQQSTTWADLRGEVASMAAWMRSVGVEPGDRVAAWMPHVRETIAGFLAAASIGAVFTSTSADFGVDGVVDRFGQTTPKVLIAADGYDYGGRSFSCLDRLSEIVERLPSVEQVLVVGVLEPTPDVSGVRSSISWIDAVASFPDAVPTYTRLPADHPLFVLYSSGTTGKPKCIVHRAGGVLLKLLSEHQLHCDIRPGDTVFYFTTCGWMMWNWLVGCLGSGATIVVFDGNPAHPHAAMLFDLVDEIGVTLLGVSAKYLDASMKQGLRPVDTHDLSTVRTICSTGSPLSHEGFAWVYDAIKRDVHLSSMSGGTDLCGCLVAGDPTAAVVAGEIQRKCLGMAIEVFDDDGAPMTAADGKGELVCTLPFPSMPLEFWNDEGDVRYRAAYFDRFDGSAAEYSVPGPIWAHGDYAAWTDRGGMVIHGRSDATLNSSGVRIGTAEIYRVVEQFEEVIESIAIGQEWDDDTRIVLFVRLADGVELTDDLQRRIKLDLRSKCSPRHVPAVIRAVADIPRTRSGKIVELAVTEVVHGRPVKNIEALANPEALELFSLD